MKYVLVAYLFLIGVRSNAQNPNAILGKWESTDKDLIVDVYRQNNAYKAKIVWFYDEDDTITPIDERLDIKNPNKQLRGRKIVGSDVLSGLNYNAKQNKWTSGRIYDASSGRTWDATVWLTTPTTLSVRGFYIFRWIGKTLNFYKVK